MYKFAAQILYIIHIKMHGPSLFKAEGCLEIFKKQSCSRTGINESTYVHLVLIVSHMFHQSFVVFKVNGLEIYPIQQQPFTVCIFRG